MDLNAILNQGFKLLTQGEYDRCAQICQAVPPRYKKNAGFLFLRARLLECQQQLDDARALYERLVSSAPDNPHFHLGLGRVLRAEGNQSAAERHIRRAIDLEPFLPEAEYLLAMILFSTGRHKDASLAAQNVVSGSPTFAEAWELLAAALQRSGRIEAAVDVCRRGCEQCPHHPRLHYALGQLLREHCDFELAAISYQTAEQLGLMSADLYQNYAEALSDAGNPMEALAVIAKGVALFPQNALMHRLYARLHFETQASGDPLEKIWESARENKASAELWKTLVELLERLDRGEDIEAAFCEILESNVNSSPGLMTLRAKHLGRQGRMQAALDQFETVASRYPDDSNALLNFAMFHLEYGQADRAISLCDRILDKAPFDQLALAYLGVGLRLMNDPREAWLFDYDRMISVSSLPLPHGYDDESHFFSALAETLTTLHHAKAHPLEQTVRGGTQTNGFLFRYPHDILVELEQQLRTVVAEIVSRFPQVPNHPFWRTPRTNITSGDIQFSGAWSVRLAGQGFHTNHVHPTGWLSAVLYVAFPKLSGAAEELEGCIQFGEPLRELKLDLPPARVVKPDVGTLVVFPSYMWHGTVPFYSDESRITVAFDVLPIS